MTTSRFSRSGTEFSPSAPSGEAAAILDAAWHGLLWLSIANAIGVWLAILLMVPSADSWLGEWTYGRWMPVHLNFQLYGWLSFPLIGWLLRVYHADRGRWGSWSVTALWAWSLALTFGALSWLAGDSSGKLFLDWSGFNRVLFPLAIWLLWFVLVFAYLSQWRALAENLLARYAKVAGLVALGFVPAAIYFASNPAIYPAVNPDSGGPTGASQLESVLVIVLLLMLLPYGLHERVRRTNRWIRTAWVVFSVEVLLCLGLGHGDVSHHRPVQYMSLGSLLVWVGLIPAYYAEFRWEHRSRRWLRAMLLWWALLIPTGWCLFLPGVLDRLKFTDGLVSHSLLAMAGFSTSLLIVVLAVLLGPDGDVFDASWAFYAWNIGTLVYVAIMVWAGWIEGANPAFTMVPGFTRNLIYLWRIGCGVAMTAASIDWFVRSGHRLRQRRARSLRVPAAGSLYGRLPNEQGVEA